MILEFVVLTFFSFLLYIFIFRAMVMKFWSIADIDADAAKKQLISELCRKLTRDVRGYAQKVCSLTRDVRGYAHKCADNGKAKTITSGLKYSLTTYNLGKSNVVDARAEVSHILKSQSGNPHIPFLFFFVTLLFLSPTMAEIKSVAINSDTKPIVSLGKFVFTIRGRISISVSSVTVLSSSAQPESSRFGFFLANDEGYRLSKMEIQKNPNLCVLNSRFIYRLFTFHEQSPPPLSSFNRSFPVFAPNQYTLFFAVCLRETSVSMLVRTEPFNINYDGGKDYLSAEQTHLSLVFLLFFLAYVAFTIFWVYIYFTSKHLIRHLHRLMIVLLIIKDLYLMCSAADKHNIKVTGVSHGWDMGVYIFQYAHVVLLFSVIVFISSGWIFLKPFLQNREKNVWVIVILFQLLAKVASVYFAEVGPPSELEWVLFMSIDFMCCGAIMCVIFWSISFLETSRTDRRQFLAKLTIFKLFGIMVMSYMGFSRIMPFILRIISKLKYWWVINVAEEICGFLFSIAVFYIFKLIEGTPERFGEVEMQLTQRELDSEEPES